VFSVALIHHTFVPRPEEFTKLTTRISTACFLRIADIRDERLVSRFENSPPDFVVSSLVNRERCSYNQRLPLAVPARCRTSPLLKLSVY